MITNSEPCYAVLWLAAYCAGSAGASMLTGEPHKRLETEGGLTHQKVWERESREYKGRDWAESGLTRRERKTP